MEMETGKAVPLLLLKSEIIFPYMVYPMRVSLQQNVAAVIEAWGQKSSIMLSLATSWNDRRIAPQDVCSTGVLGEIHRFERISEDTVRVLIEGKVRARIREYVANDQYLSVSVEEDLQEARSDSEVVELTRRAVDRFMEYEALHELDLSQQFLDGLADSMNNPLNVVYGIAPHLKAATSDQQALLESGNVKDALNTVLKLLRRCRHGVVLQGGGVSIKLHCPRNKFGYLTSSIVPGALAFAFFAEEGLVNTIVCPTATGVLAPVASSVEDTAKLEECMSIAPGPSGSELRIVDTLRKVSVAVLQDYTVETPGPVRNSTFCYNADADPGTDKRLMFLQGPYNEEFEVNVASLLETLVESQSVIETSQPECHTPWIIFEYEYDSEIFHQMLCKVALDETHSIMVKAICSPSKMAAFREDVLLVARSARWAE